ncbi:DUF599 domain-containing protein [Yoonia sp. R2331]|uniref:DUF599 domain-containing protein n=1 Tax=Yoonia sp. R2331 TaxID=3237238 RepID=UPI0034E46223
MDMTSRLSALSALDLAAAGGLVAVWLLLGWMIEHPSAKRPSVTVLMADRRRAWMREMVQREVRIFDSQILASLRQGTSFFASTNILAIGGVLALMGNTEPLSGIASEVTSEATPTVIWQLKLGLVALFLTNAFLKFVWANRVFGYCAVIMASVPNDPSDPKAMPQGMQAAELNIRAAINFNRGLRAMYFALGALVWLVGAWALFAATLIVGWVVWSREFASQPRTILLGSTE